MELIIGRKGDQSFSITDMSVSGKHLKLTTLSDGNVEVEDLGSSNGTFIDGVRIIKKVVSRNTTVQMGQRYTFKVCDVLPVAPKTPTPPPTPKPAPEYSIKHLKHVWDEYEETLVEIRDKREQMGKKRMIPMMLGSFSGIISAIFPLVGFGIGAVVTLPIAIFSFVLYFKSYNERDSSHEDTKAAKDTLIKKYVCPNPECHRTIQLQDYSIISQIPNCPYCKCKWTTK